MAIPRHSSISSEVDANWLMQVDDGVSENDPPKTRQSLLPSFQIKPCRLRHRSRKNCSSQNEKIATRFFALSSSC